MVALQPAAVLMLVPEAAVRKGKKEKERVMGGVEGVEREWAR
jgi:hypothetical protein